MIEGACHCGAVRWQFDGMPDGATACNCTVCRRYGALWAYDYENEDQSAGGAVRVGMRVRHAQFGVGNVIAMEEHTDDIKVTVRFNSVGVKKLLAKFAKLEPA